MHLQAGLIVSLFGLMASGAVVPPPDSGELAPQSLPSKMALDGDDIDLNSDEVPCNGNQTVLSCAKEIAKTWQVPVTTRCEPQRIKIPVSLLPGTDALNGYFEPLVYVEASECKLSNPSVVSQGPPIFCSIGNWCQKSFSFTTTVTETHTFGMSSTLTVSLAAEVEVPLVAKFTSTITGSETQHWEDTNSVANASTTTTTWTLAKGDICEPSVVQYGVQCKTIIRLADDATEWPATIHVAVDNKDMTMNVNCNMAEAFNKMPFSPKDTQPFADFCQAIKAEGKETTVNVGLPGSQNGIWSLQGCMWPTKSKGA